MYHLELREFPHNACRFNLGEAQMRAIVEPWAREEIVDFEERKWRPEKGRITIIEGPELDLSELSMGRGWRTAVRKGADVTAAVLHDLRGLPGARVPAAAAVEEPLGPPARAQAAPATAPAQPDAFTLGVQIAALLGPDPMGLLDAWRAAAAETHGLRPSESLARAEQALARESTR